MAQVKKALNLDSIITILCVAMVLYHLIYTQTLLLGPIEHQNMHLLFALVLVCLSNINKLEQKTPLKMAPHIILLIGTLITTLYIFVEFAGLEKRAGMNTQADIIIGLILLLVCWEVTRRAVGVVLPIISAVFVIYTLWGHHLPGPLWHFKIPLASAVSKFNIGFSGMFGASLGISADYIFLFMVFGAFLSAAGGSEFFLEIGKVIGKRFSSGAGMAAVISCGLVGMITGSGMANVSICGPFAVPMMRGTGYKNPQIGGILTAAATGALLVPPVMGVVAFVMAEYIGIPYIRVCLMSVIPALLYYFCIGVYVHLHAKKAGIVALSEDVEVSVKSIFRTSYLFLVPLTLIIILLVLGYSLRMISFVICVVTVLLSLIRKETRRSPRQWALACVDGAMSGAGIAVACALIGVVLASFDITGIGLKFPAVIGDISGGNLVVALLLIAFVTILLGCGIPPFASYMIVAMMCAPVMVKLGTTVMQAHYFLFLFSVFGQMTPPVAITAVAAAPICGTSYGVTSWEAVKAGWVAWLLPFFVIWSPIVILEPVSVVVEMIKLVAIVALVIMAQSSYVGFLFAIMTMTERLTAIAGVLGLIAFCFTTNYILLAIGAALCLVVFMSQLKKRGLKEPQSSAGTIQ